MSRGIRIFGIILSSILIFSCATERIQVARKEALDCKTPKTGYDFGNNKPMRAIKSNNRKYTRYLYHTAWNNTQNGYSNKNITRKDKHLGKLSNGLEEAKNYNIVTHSGINELMFLQQIMKSSGINLHSYELGTFPGPVRTLGEPKYVFIGPPQEDILFPIIVVNNESDNSYVVLKPKGIDEIMPHESFDETGVSIQNDVVTDHPQKMPFPKSETFVLMMAVLAGLIPFATIKAYPKPATNISFWAAMNPWKTRFMFAGTQMALITAGFMLGEELADNGMHFSDISRDLLLGAFLTSSLLYPVRHASIKLFKHSYLKQKAFDLTVAISGFMLMVNAGNDPAIRASLVNMVNLKSYEQQNVNLLNDQSQTSKQLLYYQNDIQLQNEQTAPQEEEKGRNKKILFTVLASLGALALGLLVAGGACALACNEMIGLAYLVGIGGGGLVIGLTIFVIKSIWHPKAKKRIKPSEGADSMPQEGTLLI